MFEQLMDNEQLQSLLPFVRLWYAVPSQYKWKDDAGNIHTIQQGDGGEQGDALMPALFCLALHIALNHIHTRLPRGAYVLAYLDDIYVVCEPDDVANIYDLVQTTLRDTCHIDVNIGNPAIWGPAYSTTTSDHLGPPPVRRMEIRHGRSTPWC